MSKYIFGLESHQLCWDYIGSIPLTTYPHEKSGEWNPAKIFTSGRNSKVEQDEVTHIQEQCEKCLRLSGVSAWSEGAGKEPRAFQLEWLALLARLYNDWILWVLQRACFFLLHDDAVFS